MLDPVNLLSGRGDRGAGAPEDVMNWSMYTADRGTHLKIVVVGLAAALLIAVIGISARELNLGVDIMTAQNPSVIKAGWPFLSTDRSGRTVRERFFDPVCSSTRRKCGAFCRDVAESKKMADNIPHEERSTCLGISGRVDLACSRAAGLGASRFAYCARRLSGKARAISGGTGRLLRRSRYLLGCSRSQAPLS